MGNQDSLFTRLVNASVITTAAQSYTVASGIGNGGVVLGYPMCLTATMNVVGVGAGARGGSWRITGQNQFGETVQETLDFGAQVGTGPAPGTSFYRMFTRHAYRFVSQVDKVTTYNGASLSGADTFSLGQTLQTINDPGAGATTTSILTNLVGGSNSAKQRYAFALPIPVATTGTNAAGASSTGYESEITGMVASLTASNILLKGAGWFVDAAYSTFIVDDTQVPVPGPAPGANPYLYSLYVQSNRGE